jgi:hypothetical protein
VDLPGGNGLAPEFKIARGAGILNDYALEPEIKGRPGSGINAHMAHGTADNDLLDLAFFKFIHKGGLAKTVWIKFLDDLLIRMGLDTVMDRGALCVRQKKGGTFADRYMLNVKRRLIVIPKNG